ncbi:MAG: TonB family protein [Candidatus Pedobacter colombiensis]|uniref:TonB family protein n=1 Tax=Candidatus Pedobacter colombiensis TaxID=3121371 RepID=A0AAJ5W913_9SPHI|nr:energy transducer TonB [Pedobacter sp.]WEK20948.1 MAG: TonB family protein [Pedobacter sp.]
MLGSKIDLFGNEWLDVVFDQKNKSYGAYALRRESSSNTSRALFIAGTLFILLFLSPKIISLIKGNHSIEDTPEKITPVALQPPPPINPEITPPPAAVEPPPAKQNQIKFPPPIVVEDNKVIDTDPVQVKDLANANPGQKDVLGVPDGNIVIDGPQGKGPVGAVATEDNTIYDVFVSLEVQPTFPGGMDKFYKYLSKSIRYPAMAQENNIQGKVFLSFIIEKNGTLTDIKVERKLGYGTDEEAVRVLSASPKWIAGVQNGKFVRVKYNIPISFAMPQ